MGLMMVGLLVALVVGLSLGRKAERARRARSDYLKTGALVEGMRKASITAVLDALRAGVLIAAAFVVVFIAMFHVGQS